MTDRTGTAYVEPNTSPVPASVQTQLDRLAERVEAIDLLVDALKGAFDKHTHTEQGECAAPLWETMKLAHAEKDAPTPPPAPARDRGVMLDPDGMAMPAKPPTVEELESRRKAVATAPDVVAAREFLATKKAGSVEEVVRGALNYRKSDTTPDEGDFKSREQFSVSGVHPSQDGTDFLAKEIERWDAWKEVALAYNKGFDNAPVKLTTLSREVGGVQSAVAKAIALGLAAPADRVVCEVTPELLNLAQDAYIEGRQAEHVYYDRLGMKAALEAVAAYWSAEADTQGEGK